MGGKDVEATVVGPWGSSLEGDYKVSRWWELGDGPQLVHSITRQKFIFGVDAGKVVSPHTPQAC